MRIIVNHKETPLQLLPYTGLKIAAVKLYYAKCQHLIQVGIFTGTRHTATQGSFQMIEQHAAIDMLQ